MADSVALSSDIGTWLAILLALIALIGIVGPLLLLRQSRSERAQALNAIDSRGTGYVTKGLPFGRGPRVFRKVNVAQLKLPPTPEVPFQVSVSGVALSLSSSSGWVNLASLIEAYAPNLSKTNEIRLYNKTAWLPCHRFWILGLGLRGRYGHRRDRGHAKRNINSARFRIENEGDLDDGGYGISPSTEKLYGITGTIWWRRSLTDSESIMDKIYFAPHSMATIQELGPDITPLRTLFWLSMGCLPLQRLSGEERAFDLRRFVKGYDSNCEPARSPNIVSYAYRESSPDSFSSVGGLRGDGPARNRVSHSHFRFMERQATSESGGHTQWAHAMGASMNSCRSLEFVSKSDLSEEDSRGDVDNEKSQWYKLPSIRTGDGNDFIWKPDIHCLALALGQLRISPKGFLLDPRTSLFNFFDKKPIFGLVPRLLKFTLVNSVGLRISDGDASQIRRMLKDWQDWDRVRCNGLTFSRQRAQNHYDVDEILRSRNWKIPPHVQDVVAILSVCSQKFQQELQDVARTTFGSSNWHLEIDESKNIVRTKNGDRVSLEHGMDFAEVCLHHPTVAATTATPYRQTDDIILAALRSCLRCSLFQNTLDSKELIYFVKGLEEVVYVSPNDRPPQLPQTGNNFQSARTGQLQTVHRERQPYQPPGLSL